MAAVSKTKTTLITAASTITSGSTNTSSWVDVRTYFEMLAALSITLPGSAPSAGPTITYQASPDNGTTVYTLQQLTGLTSAQDYVFTPDDAVMYFRMSVKNNDTGSNSITAGADLMHVDTVA